MRIVAHRGYCAAFPENTALAFEQAIAAGADLIETDIRLTRDGHAVCWHDPDLRRVTGDARAVAELTLAEFRSVALPQGQSPLDLVSVLTLARGRAGVMLDVKVATEAMLRAIVSALDITLMAGAVMYGVRHPGQFSALRRHAPDLRALAMPVEPESLHDYLDECVTAVRLWEYEVNAERVARIHEAGREAWVTAGRKAHGESPGYLTVERAAALANLGIDAVLVNDPRWVRSGDQPQNR